MLTDPAEVLGFWIDEIGPEGWYAVDPAIDEAIERRFGQATRVARAAAHDDWILAPEPALALMILLDQFPRNLHRGSGEAFASDRKALALAKRALVMGHDLAVPEPERQFFYLPLMHSENVSDQNRCCRLMKLRMPLTGAHNLVHARAHREVIRRFGRFPFRNDALGRGMTAAEAAWLEQGGYGTEVEALSA